MNLQIFAGLFLFGLALEDLWAFARQARAPRIDRWTRRFRPALFVQALFKVILAGLLASEGLKILQNSGFSI